MGVVARQGIKYSIISYLSFLLGTFSTIFIYPADTTFLGQLRFIQPSAEIIFPFVVFGLSYANIKFYQQFKAKNQNLDFLVFSIKFIVISFLIICLLYWLFASLFPSIGNSDSWKMKQYVLPVILILALSQLFSKYISNFKRVAITGIFENFFPKLGSLVAFICFVYLGISEINSLYIFIFFFFAALSGLIVYFLRLNKDKPSGSLSILSGKNFRKELFYFCIFSVLGSIGNQLALRIDNLMISELISYKQNGIYSILMSIVGFLSVPLAGVFAISGPIIVEKLENNQHAELNDFYQKISKFLFLFGTVLLSCIFAGCDYLFLLMKNGHELSEAKSIIYILGIATLFDISTGFNSQIITYSRYYRFNIYAMLLLAVLTISSNWIFIVYFNLGIEGVAMATAISLTIYNIIKLIFNYRIFKIQPFTRVYLYILITGISAVILAWSIPDTSNNLINLLLKPLVVIIIFLIINLWLKFFPFKEIFSTNLKSFLSGKK
ncbi:lipopolysaccharide biosynthesis protein [Apibacter sp. HY039]|uniref:lipopolysaccharide biosynthesis protein n=1 Tax=Apibacter sp. HY039 TaxID=2501476 RepID=UPI000FEBD00E|nr:lipopolysaccharide biosynthesis protein [Apibacter sp. HY039]